MKKIISIVLLLTMVLTFTACKKNGEGTDTAAESSEISLFEVTVDMVSAAGEKWEVLNISSNIRVEKEGVSSETAYTFYLRGLSAGDGLFVIARKDAEGNTLVTKVYTITVDENLVVTGECYEDEQANTDSLNADAKESYKQQLEAIFSTPDDYGEIIEGGSIENCTFGLADVTDDDVVELIVNFTEGSMAGNKTSVWTYNADTEKVELYGETSAGAVFYKDGFVKCDFSHNQECGETIWPYTVMKYNAQTKAYDAMFFGWCMDKPEFEDSNSTYDPAEDTDGDGVIYYFGPSMEDATPLTLEEYNTTSSGIIGENKMIAVDYLNITVDNIAAVAE